MGVVIPRKHCTCVRNMYVYVSMYVRSLVGVRISLFSIDSFRAGGSGSFRAGGRSMGVAIPRKNIVRTYVRRS